jgi:hypothetical protein
MSSTLHRNIRTYMSGGVIAEATFVKYDTDGVRVVACGANGRAIGIAQGSTTAANQAVEVAMIGGGARLKVAGTTAAGKCLTSDASGLGVVGSASGQWIGAVALEAGVANDITEVEVSHFQLVADDT